MIDLFQIKAQLFIHDVVGILIIYQSLVFLIFLIASAKAKPAFRYILELIYATISCHFLYILIENHFLTEPLMLGFFFGLTYGPLFFLYTLSLIVSELKIKTIISHFTLPTISFLALIIIHSFSLSQWLIEANVLLSIVVTVHISLYLIFSLLKIKSYKKQLSNLRSSIDSISLRWLSLIIVLMLAAIFCAMLQSILVNIIPMFDSLFISLTFVLVLTIVNCLYYLGLRQVSRFSGIPQELSSGSRDGKFTMDSKEVEDLGLLLSKYMVKNEPYKEFELSLDDLAKAINLTSRKLSYVINSNFNLNFFEFVNGYRIEEAKRLLKNENLSIKEVMYDCGFSNKSTFNSFFKKLTGLTPSEFRKK